MKPRRAIKANGSAKNFERTQSVRLPRNQVGISRV